MGLKRWEHKHIERTALPLVTILIPARNEENTILNLLSALNYQTYRGSIEILVINDHSQDRTTEIVRKFISENPDMNIQLLNMPGHEDSGSKKEAISFAIQKAKGEIIVTTDADCMPGEGWLDAILEEFLDDKVQLVTGPVNLQSDGSFFGRFQQLEFAGLVAIGAGTLGNGLATMCNGANLAYRKRAFYAVGGYAGNEHIPSGDDEFLMHKIFEKYAGGVRFCPRVEAVMNTQSTTSLSQFYQQRIRWVSKSTKYAKGHILFILVMAWIFYFGVLAHLFLPVFFPQVLFLSIFIFGIKILAEFWFYRKALPLFNMEANLVLIIKSQIPHLIYTLTVGILGNIAPYQWKNRQVKRAILNKLPA